MNNKWHIWNHQSTNKNLRPATYEYEPPCRDSRKKNLGLKPIYSPWILMQLHITNICSTRIGIGVLYITSETSQYNTINYSQLSLYRHSIQRQNSIKWQYVCHKNLRSKGESKREIMQENCIKTSSNICFGYLLESPHWCNSNKYPKHMFSEEIRIKQGLPYI